MTLEPLHPDLLSLQQQAQIGTNSSKSENNKIEKNRLAHIHTTNCQGKEQYELLNEVLEKVRNLFQN